MNNNQTRYNEYYILQVKKSEQYNKSTYFSQEFCETVGKVLLSHAPVTMNQEVESRWNKTEMTREEPSM